jgi:DNA helicase II / ATP-dependent DNA helicase PcrA
MNDNAIPDEEERLLAKVQASLAARAAVVPRDMRYDQELVALRDEIGEARREDVPALWAQMERLQGVSRSRAEAQGMLVDPRAPYFGHLSLDEQVAGRGGVRREVFIGRATFVDPAARVNIVDWRDAPISQLYYRYPEGSDYEERFGEREVEGEILARRTVTIEEGALLRVEAPQGVWRRARTSDPWEHAPATAFELAGGEGTAVRPTAAAAAAAAIDRGTLGSGARGQRLDRHLPEIAALLDPRQFDLITRVDSGVVVIQGGAGSGKTTVGLHRMAYLAYRAPNRFPPKGMLVVTYGSALAGYISQLLPSLGVHGVKVMTFQTWAERALHRAIPWLGVRVVEDAPAAVTRAKSHPALLAEIERRARAHRGKRNARAVIDLWAELVTDRGRLEALLGSGPSALHASDVAETHRFMVERASAVVDRAGAGPAAERRRPRLRVRLRADNDSDDDDGDRDAEVRGDTGIDGARTEGEDPELDLGDAALLLRADQLLRGSRRKLAHLFVDEAQDLSPLELAVLIGEMDERRSVTLAGDTAQRLFLDNGFHDWRTVLSQLHLEHVAVEPLRISYRSTREILTLARFAMGPLAGEAPPQAPRSGAPVEAHRFPGTGAAVAFLAEALRPLFQREPRATVAILARHPEQADRYHAGLRRAEIPSLRRVRAQDFAFRPGVEVTEIRQVKGLEFDYVVLVDANAASFGTDDESRHLFHIAATRAAHQLWLLVTAPPSPLIPPALLQQS